MSEINRPTRGETIIWYFDKEEFINTRENLDLWPGKDYGRGGGQSQTKNVWDEKKPVLRKPHGGRVQRSELELQGRPSRRVGHLSLTSVIVPLE